MVVDTNRPIRRFLLSVRKNAFLLTVYFTLFWLRVFDFMYGTRYADSIAWMVLFLTPVIFMEPIIRDAVLFKYWMEKKYFHLVDIITIIAMFVYVSFIKFTIKGMLPTTTDLVFLIFLSALYKVVNLVRERTDEVGCFCVIFALSIVLASLMYYVGFASLTQ